MKVIGGRSDTRLSLILQRVADFGLVADFDTALVVCAGGRPSPMDHVVGWEHAINSDGFFELEEQPKKAFVVGAGCVADTSLVLQCVWVIWRVFSELWPFSSAVGCGQRKSTVVWR